MIFRVKIKFLKCTFVRVILFLFVFYIPDSTCIIMHLPVTAFIRSIRRDRPVHVAPVTRTAVSRIRPIFTTSTTITTRDR